MRALIAFALLPFVACGTSLRTADGHTLMLDGVDVDPRAVDQAVRFYSSRIIWVNGMKPKDVADAVDRLHFIIVPDSFPDPNGVWDSISGYQDGRTIKVGWKDGVSNNALFHELHHRIDQVVYGRIDYTHSNEEWWGLLRIIKGEWNELSSVD